MMVFNNALCKMLTPEYIDDANSAPQSLNWADGIGSLPSEWNHCVFYDEIPAETPKLVHYTAGLPCWPETKDCPYSEEWWNEFRATNSTVAWRELMGQSVHAQMIMDRVAKRASN